MEKRTPHTRLSQVKKLVNAGQVRTTRSALLNADELGLDFDGMCNVIIGLSESDFYKSMTTYSDHTIWQDVYRPGSLLQARVYLKITVIHDVLIVSFKEK
ncbi:type II toxin-antitoxin system MqsR family toxin [Escherichia coli]|nr:type II toxin-antitoxin system MqsR family toxin [Escherichia coli]